MQTASTISSVRYALRVRWKAAAAVAVAALALLWFAVSLIPTRYSANALLEFDTPPATVLGTDEFPGAKGQAAGTLARSILSKTHFGVLLDRSREETAHDGLEAEDRPGAELATSRIYLEQPSGESLRIRYVSSDRQDALDVTNAVAGILSQWTPDVEAFDAHTSPPALPSSVVPGPPSFPPAESGIGGDLKRSAELGKRLLELAGSNAKLADSVRESKQAVAALEAERQQIARETRLPSAKRTEETESSRSARIALETQVGAAKKHLADLRIRYTDEYPDVETARDQLSDLEAKLAALPITRVVPVTAEPDHARLDAVDSKLKEARAEGERRETMLAAAQRETSALQNQEGRLEHSAHRVDSTSAASNLPGIREPKIQAPASAPPADPIHALHLGIHPFTVLQKADTAEAINQSTKLGWMGLSLVLALAVGAGYVGLATFFDRPIRDEAALRRELPARVSYLGSIPRMHL